MIIKGNSLVVQWLRLQVPKSGDMGLIYGWGTEILHAQRHGFKKKFFSILVCHKSSVQICFCFWDLYSIPYVYLSISYHTILIIIPFFLNK